MLEPMEWAESHRYLDAIERKARANLYRCHLIHFRLFGIMFWNRSRMTSGGV